MAWTEQIKSGHRGRYRDANGMVQTAGDASTKKEAKALAHAEELKIRAGTWVDPKRGKVSFSEYFEEVWFPNRDAVVERYTQQAYWSSYTKHFKPFFGHRELRSITSTLVQRWVTKLNASGLHPNTVAKLHKHLQTVLAGRRGSSARAD